MKLGLERAVLGFMEKSSKDEAKKTKEMMMDLVKRGAYGAVMDQVPFVSSANAVVCVLIHFLPERKGLLHANVSVLEAGM